jgi:hypothetical protein
MCKVCTSFARERRFQFSGPKCGILHFGATRAQRQVVAAETWEIFGERVEVVDTYEYLGSATTARPSDWRAHVHALVRKAKAKSADLLWMCRAGSGMRPRTTIVLFNSLVRPILEYCAVLWEGCIPAALVREVELVQSTFIRAASGAHKTGMGISNDILRAEHGVETLASRRHKLKLGFWRRLQTLDQQRTLHRLVTIRSTQVRAGNAVLGARSLMRSFRDSLTGAGLAQYWLTPENCVAEYTKQKWKLFTYARVDGLNDRARGARMAARHGARLYIQVKHWGENDPGHAAYPGEVGRLGFRVPEPYLDDRASPWSSVRLKLLTRGGALPLMDRIGRERGWPRSARRCLMCRTGEVEDVPHMMMDCPAYAVGRAALLERIQHIATRQGFASAVAERFDALGRSGLLLVMLGQRVGNAAVEGAIDLAVKMFLAAVWRERAVVREAINLRFGRDDS